MGVDRQPLAAQGVAAAEGRGPHLGDEAVISNRHRSKPNSC